MNITHHLFKPSYWYRIFLVKSFFLISYFANISIDNINKSEIKKILILHTDSFGDMVIFTPALRNLYNLLNFPEITIITSKRVVPFIKKSKYVKKVLSYGEGEISINECVGIVRTLRKEKFDLVIDTQSSFLTLKRTLLPILSKAKYRVGFRRGNGYSGILNSIEVDYKKKHGAECFLDLIRALKITPKDDFFEVFYDESDEKHVESLITGLKNKKIIIHPGNSNKTKTWEAKKFAEVADYLANKYNADIIITGTNQEKEICDEVLKNIKNKARNLVGRLSPSQYCASLKKVDLLICLDSFPVHAAAATNTPTVALYGPTYIIEWFPWNKNKQIMLTQYDSCKGCKNTNKDYILPTESKERKCTQPEYCCLTRITPKEVISACEKLLETN